MNNTPQIIKTVKEHDLNRQIIFHPADVRAPSQIDNAL
jgi:hypothetical protein